MKLSISNIAWPADKDTEMYSYLREQGFKGLEIAPTRIFPDKPYDHLAEAEDWVANLREEYNLEVPSMQSIWYGHQEKIFGDAQDRKILIDYTKKAILFAEAINCKNLVFGNPRQRDTDNVVENMPIAIDFFREIGDYAADHNTIVALEANPQIYNTRFLNRTKQAVEMAYKSNSKGIKVNVDLGTIIENKEDVEYLRQIPEYINHVHISEPGLKAIEHREILHKELISILKDIKYDRFISIEMGNHNGIEELKNAIKYIKGLCIA